MVLESNTLDVLFVKDGQQGEDGKVLYTWIKYAKAANGTGMTDDPDGAIYIGISYNNESSIESNDPTQYAWTKIQGADGKKGEDAYTIFLENENISFATDKNRNPLSEQAYTSGITIMKGAKPVTGFTIGDIAKTQGIAVAKTDTAIAISVVNGNPLPNDSGEIEIPITVGGTVFKKILTWTCAKKGDQGERGLQGIQGPQGEQGIAGKDGTSVTIINKSITYQLSTSGTVIPTGTWQTSPQTIPEGQYQWTKTSVTYSDGNQTESYSISYHGKNGSDGTSVKTTSTSVKYQVGDSGTTKPTGTWQSNVPTVAQGKYLWTQTIVNYSDGNSTESYSVSYRGIDGSNGVNGMNAATIYLYQRATSTPSKPSNTLTYTFSTTKITGTLNNGWSTAIPTGTDAVYVTVASVSSKNDTATITTSAWSTPVVLAQNGKTGSDGKAGLNVATIYLYQRNTSKPSKPSASVTYTFSTGVASGLNNGWSQKIPDGTNPLYVTLATASSNTATDTILSSEWSDVVVMAQNGEDGISPKVSLSKTGGTTTISIVDATGTHTQSVKDGTNGTPGTDGKDGKTSYFHVKYSNDGGKTFTGNSGEDTGIYMGSYTDYTEADSTDVKKYNWVKVKGDKGDTGQKGQDGTSVKITSKSVTYQTSTSGTTAPTGTWVTTVPTVNNGQYLWTKTTVQYSDGNKTEAYSVSYKGTNGTNGTSVTVSKTEVTYQVSTSGTTAPTGTWSTTMPSCDQGQYLWTKTYVKYSDGKDTTSYSVSYKGVDGEKFAFNMLRETNQGSKHWVNMGASGKYSVESITTEDSINAVKLICTEPIASNEWQFCDFSDYEMLKSLKASTTYTLSYDIKTNRSGKILHNIKTGGGQKVFFANDIACKVLGNETWEHVSLKMTSGTTLPNLDGQVIYMFGDALSKVGYSIIKNLKLTEGIIDTPWAPHPEDLEGRGVSETVQYYLATSQASGVTSSTSGWSTDITTQKLTADKKYLWNCYQTKYSDGTSEPISTPKVIGVYGDKGQNAKNLTITPSSQYFKSTDGGKTFTPDTITIKPTIQGEINFGKWQYSIDGGVSFADVMSGQKGLMISNNVLTVSKDSSLYSDAVTMVTFRAVASDSSFYDTCSIAKIYDVSDIGDGRNLLWNSNFAKTDETINTSTYTTWGLILRGSTYTATIDTSVKHNNFNTLKVIGTKAGENGGQDLIYRIKGLNLDEVKFTEIDVKYTLSFYAKASIACNFSARYPYDSYAKDTNVALSTDWKRYEIQMHPTTASYQTSLIFKMDAASTVWFSEFKLEKGSSATGYSTAPEDVQMEILSTKSEISDVSLKVDNNRQAIEQRVEKTTYEQDLNLVKGDISKANEGLNKWRYEIYPKSLFTSEYQGKSTMDVFAKNTNLTPSQSVLINDMDLSIAWNYDNNYIGYALTFAKFSAAKSVAITFAHDDGAHIYLNGKLIGGSDAYSQTGESLTLGFVKGWNCIEVVVNEGASTEGFKLGTTISAISECQLMNCYYGTPVARQSHITNQLVQNTTDIDGVSGSVQKVMSTVGGSGKVDEFVNNYSTWKKKVDGIETRVGETYTTKDDFNGLEIGGRNLVRLGGLSGNGATSFSYDKTTDTYTIVSPVVSTVWGTGAAVKYDDNHKVLIPYGKTYILSFEVKVPQALSINIDINNYTVSGSSWAGNDNDDGSTRGQSSYSIPANTWTKVWVRWANTNTKNTNKVDLYDNSSIGLVTKDCTSAVTWQIRHVKGELGNKPTDWTPAPEDVNGKIVNVETIANQTAKKFEWIVKGGDNSSNFTLTDRVADLVAERINFKGLVTFSGTTNLIENSNMMNGLANITSECKAIKVIDDSTYRKALVITPIAGGRIFWGVANVWKTNITYSISFVAKSSVAGQKIKPSRSLADWGDEITLTTSYTKYTTRIKSTATVDGGTLSFSFSNAIGDVTLTNVKLETGMNPTDWAPAPGDYITQASLVRNWTTNTTWINGGKIYTGSITADKIATDAIKSRNYISSGGTQGSFLNLSDGSFQSPNLSWDANGNLIASNANLSGLINATKGTVGGWNIATNGLYSGIDENAIKIYSATTYDAQTMYQKQKIQDSFILSQKYINHFVSQQVSVGHNIPYWQTRSFIYNDSQIQLAQSDYCINTSSASNYDAQYSLKDGYISATRIYMEQNITQVGGDVINSSFSIGLDSMMGWCSIQSTKGINIYGNSSRALYVQSNDTSKYNALETEGDVVVNGKIHAVSGDNKIQLNSDNNGSIELYGNTPFIDFHSAYSSADYTCRIIANTPEQLLVCGKLRCDSNIISNNDLIANSWVYAGQNAHYTWQNQLDCYFSCGYYNNTNNVYYYAGYHAFYVNGDSGSGMMYIDTSGVSSRKGFRNSSDERIKQNFSHFDDNFIDTYMSLEPVQYQFKNDTDDKYHFGFKAQQTERILNAYGQESDKSYGICATHAIDSEKAEKLYGVKDMHEEYTLAYDELIAPTTYMVQHIYKELESTKEELIKVKQEKADLEARLQAIEAKLGL